MTYRLSVEERTKRARQQQSQYWRDPEHRLKRVNAYRQRRGLPLASDVSQIGQSKPRGSDGRFTQGPGGGQ